MNATDIIGWTYDADIHCNDCALARFGAAVTLYPWDGRAKDSEGNEPHPIFASDECGETGEYCGDCGREVSEPWLGRDDE